jgi:hypothetical protein
MDYPLLTEKTMAGLLVLPLFIEQHSAGCSSRVFLEENVLRM